MTPTARTLVEQVAPHSIEISQNAKGDLSFSVKVYATDENDAVDRAATALERLRQRISKGPSAPEGVAR